MNILLEDLNEDLREMGIRIWERKEENKNDWATNDEEALTLHGL